MKRVIILGPGPLHPGEDGGLGMLAALAARHLRRSGIEVVAISPVPSCPIATFANRTYAEPVDAHALAAIVAKESCVRLLATFGGQGALESALDVLPQVDVLGLPDGRSTHAALHSLARSSDASAAVRACLVVELLVDVAGDHIVIGALESRGLGPLTDALLRTPRAATMQLEAIALRAARELAATGAFGVFSLSFRLTASGDPTLVEVHAGARATTVAAARACRFPLAPVAVDVALGRRLRSLDLPKPLMRPATRTPVLVHDRYPGSETAGVAAGLGQTLAFDDPSTERDASVAEPARAHLFVAGAGANHVDQTGWHATWIAAAVRVARERGFEVTVVDDDPGSLAGALADSWHLAPPDRTHALARGNGAVFAPAAAIPPERRATMHSASIAWADARKIDVLVLCDGAATALIGTVEYVEPVSVHTGDSAAFFPVQTVLAPDVLQAEDMMRSVAREARVRGLCTGTFALSSSPVLVALSLGPSNVEPFVSKATGLPLPELATHLTFGATLASLGLADIPAPAFVAARESVMPRALLAASRASLDGTKRSIGEAMGVGQTAADAYRKALAGVGFRIRPASRADATAVILAPREDHANDAARAARKLYPLGYRIIAVGPVVHALRALRIPFEEASATHAAAALEAGPVALAFVSALRPPAERTGLELRRAALARGVPCFTSPLLFHGACAVLEADIEPPVCQLPTRLAAD